MRILVVEDDAVLAAALTRALSQAAYAVDHVEDGEAANNALATVAYDLVVLDLALPKVDGLAVLKRLRDRRSHVPVLILTARDTLEDRVAGLDQGADDYLTKPFDLPEFEARVRALLRRGHYNAGGSMIANRMDNVGIVLENLDAAIEFFTELGLVPFYRGCAVHQMGMQTPSPPIR